MKTLALLSLLAIAGCASQAPSSANDVALDVEDCLDGRQPVPDPTPAWPPAASYASSCSPWASLRCDGAIVSVLSFEGSTVVTCDWACDGAWKLSFTYVSAGGGCFSETMRSVLSCGETPGP